MEEQEFIGGDVNCGGRREPADISRWFWKKTKEGKRNICFQNRSFEQFPFLLSALVQTVSHLQNNQYGAEGWH